MKNLIFLFIAFCIGGLIPVQGAVNAHLGKSLNHPLQATFISFFSAVAILVLILMVLTPSLPSVAQLKSVPLVYYSGGACGMVFVTTILVLAPRIGIANTIVATIVGQLIISVILDHFGVLGLAKYSVSGLRILGCFGLMISLYLIQCHH